MPLSRELLTGRVLLSLALHSVLVSGLSASLRPVPWCSRAFPLHCCVSWESTARATPLSSLWTCLSVMGGHQWVLITTALLLELCVLLSAHDGMRNFTVCFETTRNPRVIPRFKREHLGTCGLCLLYLLEQDPRWPPL